MSATVLLHSCSTERTPPTLPGAHQDEWMDLLSPDFHARFVYEDGTASCEICHGIGTPGGKSGVSCLDCHASGTGSCDDCHGGVNDTTGAPPYGLRGETSFTELAVGAHTAHLDTLTLANPVPCNSCHSVPAFVLSPSHLDQDRPGGQPLDSIAEIIWHGFADGGNASWDRVSRTCSGTYCHGNFSGGNSANRPVWTGTDQATCGSCHDVGDNPAGLGWKHAEHLGSTDLLCTNCHASVVDSMLNIIDLNLHVNGQVDTLVLDRTPCRQCHGTGAEVCTSCHGGRQNQTGAPPYGLRGEIFVTDLAVGGHTAHVAGGPHADAFECSICHRVPQSPIDFGHFGQDSIAEVIFDSFAGASSSWDRSTATCTNTYCHGNFPGGNAANAPQWTGFVQAYCGSCHDYGLNPNLLSGEHGEHVADQDLGCVECHATVIGQQGNLIDLTLHVNRINDVVFLKGGTFQGETCSGLNGTSCHGQKSWYE